jgi:hypothetical protein
MGKVLFCLEVFDLMFKVDGDPDYFLRLAYRVAKK